MPSFQVQTAQRTYENVVERGVLNRAARFIPNSAGKCFVVTTEDVWHLHGTKLEAQLAGHSHQTLFFVGGEQNKRLSHVEKLADEMLAGGADRASLVIGFGGGIVTDISGFLAAIYMRGVPVLQIPTTLLAQVDAATGGKTGVNLAGGKNLMGSFHQPLAVLIDPEVISTLPEREYRAGLFEVVKCGIIRDPRLFNLLHTNSRAVLAQEPAVVDELICGAIRIKAEVVSADEREGGLRRILNFGHTIGHAVEAETGYLRMLHGEAVAWGMKAATKLAVLTGKLEQSAANQIITAIDNYGPLPAVQDLNPSCLLERLAGDKKTLQGKVHFVLPSAIGQVDVISGVEPAFIRSAIEQAFASTT